MLFPRNLFAFWWAFRIATSSGCPVAETKTARHCLPSMVIVNTLSVPIVCASFQRLDEVGATQLAHTQHSILTASDARYFFVGELKFVTSFFENITLVACSCLLFQEFATL